MISDGIDRNKKFFSYQFIAKAIDDTFENFGLPVVELGLSFIGYCPVVAN
jgi:hypothetical protein